MEKRVFSILKKILIVAIIFTTIGVAMPKKAKADVINDFISLFLRIPDGVMSIIDGIMAGSNEFTMEELDFKGWDSAGYLYNFQVTPYTIFTSGVYEKTPNGKYYTKIGYLDINFFSDKAIVTGSNQSEENVSSTILAPVIGNIYTVLRDFCMVLMLLVIMYIGIKIMISSIAEQQAKYKRALIDWAVGFALLFIMHYIMSGIVNLNTLVLSLLKSNDGDEYYVGIAELQGMGDSTWYKVANGQALIKDVSWDNGSNQGTSLGHGDEAEYEFKYNRLLVRNSSSQTDTYGTYIGEDGHIDLKAVSGGSIAFQQGVIKDYSKWGENGEIYLSASLWNPKNDIKNWEKFIPGWQIYAVFKELDNFASEHTSNKAIVKLNALSYVRTVSSFASGDNQSVLLYQNGSMKCADLVTTMGYSALYVCLVIETIMFLFIYIKRVLQLAFYTMIAPIVAIMYPLDRLGDGKAQSFNAWVKDYIFNVLIQPMHLLLYMVFITAAGQLITKNIIYAMAVYGFMIPAEKYFKKVLGFEKASTAGGGPISNAIGRGLAMEGLGKLAGIGPAGRGGAGGGKSSSGRKKMRLGKLTPPSQNPASGGDSSDNNTPMSGGLPSSRGTMAGDNSPRAGGGNAQQRGNSNRSAPGASGGRRLRDRLPKYSRNQDDSILLNSARPFARTVANRAIRGATGGKYELGDPAKKIGKEAGIRAGKFVGKAVSRAAGVVTMGALGTVVGAASAMATGDINNLWKGASVGAGAGNKWGSNISGRVGDFVSEFADDVKQERANSDDGYLRDLRQEKARENYKEYFDTLSSADRENAIKRCDKYSPYMNEIMNGDEKTLETIGKIEDKLGSQDISTNVQAMDDSNYFGKLYDKKNQDAFKAYFAAGGPGELPKGKDPSGNDWTVDSYMDFIMKIQRL